MKVLISGFRFYGKKIYPKKKKKKKKKVGLAVYVRMKEVQNNFGLLFWAIKVLNAPKPTTYPHRKSWWAELAQ